MQRLSYVAVLLVAIMRYRSFIQPHGMNQIIQPSDVTCRELVEDLRVAIEKCPENIPFTEVRKRIETVAFAHILERHDRRVVRTYIRYLFAPEAPEDGFYTVSGKADTEKWNIRPNLRIPNCPSIVQQLSIFACTDIFGTTPQFATANSD